VIRILVVDDHELVRTVLVAALRAAGGFDVVGVCQDGQQAIDQAAMTKPDVILMDLCMPGVDGIEATRQIVSSDPAVRVVILTATGDRRLVGEALAAGAVTCLFKDGGLEAVLQSVRRAGSRPLLGSA
jgi:DNA-binding NarL/FixJ family response regulator